MEKRWCYRATNFVETTNFRPHVSGISSCNFTIQSWDIGAHDPSRVDQFSESQTELWGLPNVFWHMTHIAFTNMSGCWYTYLKNHGVRQLGWWHSQYTENKSHVPNHQSVYIYISYIPSNIPTWLAINPIYYGNKSHVPNHQADVAGWVLAVPAHPSEQSEHWTCQFRRIFSDLIFCFRPADLGMGQNPIPL